MDGHNIRGLGELGFMEGSSLTHFYLPETVDPAQVYSEIMQVFPFKIPSGDA